MFKNLWAEYGPKIKTRTLIIGILIILFISIIVLVGEFKKLPNGKLQMVVCDVGQGDAIYLKTPRGFDILVDGGPDNSVLSCLGRHMPFWDRKIELIFLTHPHADHATGLFAVKNRYRVGQFFDDLVTGDKITTRDGIKIEVLNPVIRGNDQNANSIVLKIGKILLTGDSSLSNLNFLNDLSNLEILKVPHHGSRDSLDEDILKILNPKTAVVSAGKGNSFGHPAPETISLLEKYGIKTRRTDLEGEIIIAP
jgi:competence protein ComEC